MYFEDNQEAPAELVLGEAGEENNSAGSCQLSAEMKGKGPAECAIMTAALCYLRSGVRVFIDLTNTTSKNKFYVSLINSYQSCCRARCKHHLLLLMAAQMPPLKLPETWTSAALKELKAKLRMEEDSVVTVYRGDIMTVHVPTVPEAKKVCWEFATDGYDIGFGIYFDWTPVTNRSITVHISESSDDEDEEEELEGQFVLCGLNIASSSFIFLHLGSEAVC